MEKSFRFDEQDAAAARPKLTETRKVTQSVVFHPMTSTQGSYGRGKVIAKK